MDQPTLAAHILAGAAARDRCPLVFSAGDEDRRTTLGALISDAETAAGALQGRGVGSGDVVAVQLPGSYEGAVIQAAVALCGAVLLPVVMIYGPREMDFMLRRSGATAVVLPREHRGRPHAGIVLDGLSGLPALKFAVVVGDDAPGHGAVGYAGLLGQPGGTYRQPSPDPDDRAVLMYTSGTTADPKGVQHSHRTLLAEATSRVYTLNGPGARHLGLFPPGHMAGLLSLLRILLLGTPTVIMQAWDAALAARLIDRHAVTSCGGAPVQLSGLLDQQAAGTAALGTLREFLTGAAPVPPSLIRRAEAAGITAFRSYGSSEHPTVTTGTIADPLDLRAGTDGRLLAGNEVRLVDAGWPRRARRRGGRDPHPRPRAVHRLHRPGAERGRVPARRLVPDRGRRADRRRRPPDGHRPAQGHHHPRRREHLRQGGRGPAGHAPGGGGRGGDPRPRPGAGRTRLRGRGRPPGVHVRRRPGPGPLRRGGSRPAEDPRGRRAGGPVAAHTLGQGPQGRAAHPPRRRKRALIRLGRRAGGSGP